MNFKQWLKFATTKDGMLRGATNSVKKRNEVNTFIGFIEVICGASSKIMLIKEIRVLQYGSRTSWDMFSIFGYYISGDEKERKCISTLE